MIEITRNIARAFGRHSYRSCPSISCSGMTRLNRRLYINTYRSEDDEDYESLSDRDINKLLIFTQTSLPSSRAPKHEGYDRTGDWTTRVKMTQELEQLINDGLFYYEQELWNQDGQWNVRIHVRLEI